ncbi:MAG: thioredoxin family protein [Lysobacterales bacterium]
MIEPTVPEFFHKFPMQRVHSADLDAALADATAALAILFLWGRDCPNCDNAKRAILNSAARFHWPEVQWLHGNVYEEPALGTRFGLHGIPAFIVFRGVRKIGRVTPWPGADAFAAAIERQIAALAHNASRAQPNR